jgi:hypothetical protein
MLPGFPTMLGGKPEPIYSLSGAASVPEGSVLWVTATTENVPAGTTLYLNTNSAGDFSVPQDSASVGADGTATLSLTTSADQTTEGNEAVTVYLRTGGYTGTIVAQRTVTITDTSTTPPIEYVGGAVFDSSTSNWTINFGGSLTGGIASSATTGDLVIVAVGVNENNSSLTMSASGWSQFGTFSVNSAYDVHFSLFYRFLPSTDNEITVGFSGFVFARAVVMAFRNVNSIGNFSYAPDSNGGQPNPPANTIPSGGRYVCAGAGTRGISFIGSNFSAPDMDVFRTTRSNFLAIGMGFSSTDNDAAEFNGGNSQTSASAAAVSFNLS